ncbi:group II intron maturase-specific domain-containing protein [Paenibacillus brasilensis]|uniref:Group II intron maturase-specific domain-containing protein n=1 Tax=Paenibacillus brasilensis TaxID=128574 RepID=A0ABU0KS24_9BACL|nr:group II intron maturase-specific domain-containing protein [Paenibacillus brasilensis]MDQ0492230.1 hypothetical protein [Paenibacillus brasilensis]
MEVERGGCVIQSLNRGQPQERNHGQNKALQHLQARLFFISFIPGASNSAKKAMRQTIRTWRIQLKSEKKLEDLSKMFNPILRGWVNYYGRLLQSGNAFGISTHESSVTELGEEKVQKIQASAQTSLGLAQSDCKARTDTLRSVGEELFLSWAG